MSVWESMGPWNMEKVRCPPGGYGALECGQVEMSVRGNNRALGCGQGEVFAWGVYGTGVWTS